jgi:hypothetical protein
MNMKKKQLIALGVTLFVLAACNNPFFPEKRDIGGNTEETDGNDNTDGSDTDPVSITSVAVTVTTPAAGKLPNTTASGTGNFTIGPVLWTPDDHTFMVGKAYTAAVTLTANTDHVFAENQNLSASINGQSATVINNNNSTLTLSYAFAIIADPNTGTDGTTADTAFKVYDVETLNRVGKGAGSWVGDWSLSAYYVQTADIVLPPVNAGESNWTAIGDWSNQFTGTYDGGGCTISNLTINVSSGYQGMFGLIGTGGVVKNVGLVGGSVSGSYYIGGVVGQNNGTVQNCYTTSNVSSLESYTGGVVGSNDGTVQNCYTTGNVSSSMSSSNAVGGVVGRNDGTVQNCVALNPRVTHGYSITSIGRVIGSLGTRANNYARSDLIPKEYYNWNGNTTGTDKTVVSDLNGRDGQDITPAQYHSESWWSNAGNWKTDGGASAWDFVNVWEWNPVTNLPILRGFSSPQNHTVPPIP